MQWDGPPGSCVHGISQARILEWVAVPSSRGSSQPRDQTWVSCIAGEFFTIWASREAQRGYRVKPNKNKVYKKAYPTIHIRQWKYVPFWN